MDCPNAYFNGSSTSFCEGTATDDVVAHEWTHGYTQETHGLVYAWQSGALNESYSDIFGEIVDLLYDSGSDVPSTVRPAGICSAATIHRQIDLAVEEPAAIAGPMDVRSATFNPAPPWSVTGDVELADDGVGLGNDGCDPLVGFHPRENRPHHHGQLFRAFPHPGAQRRGRGRRSRSSSSTPQRQHSPP